MERDDSSSNNITVTKFRQWESEHWTSSGDWHGRQLDTVRGGADQGESRGTARGGAEASSSPPTERSSGRS